MIRRNQKITYLTYDYGRYSETEYKDWLSNKRVIIVGPAGYLRGQNKGKWIDSFDVVVRVNHAIPILFPEDYGTRTDVLYHIFSHRNIEYAGKKLIDIEEIDEWVNAGVKWLVSRHGTNSKRFKQVAPLIDSKLPWCCIHHSFTGKIDNAISSRSPNTGVVAIMHLLSSGIKSLTITGFDLYQSGVYQGYGDISENEDAREVNDRWHDIESQITYLKKIVIRDKRIHIDTQFEEVLYGKEI
jgi:hypothetical protein